MPTPLVHLYLAQEALAGAPAGDVPAWLPRHAGDFLLGAIAPDAWSLGHATRQEAHIPPFRAGDQQGHLELLRQYPQLQATVLSAGQAAFVAGYMAHLCVDEIWYHEVFHPYFGPGAGRPVPLKRLVLHNVLRIHLENKYAERLDGESVVALGQASACYGIPPFSDADLQAWRDGVHAELLPGGRRRSVEVLAGRLGVPADEMTRLLESPRTIRERCRRLLSRAAQRHQMAQRWTPRAGGARLSLRRAARPSMGEAIRRLVGRDDGRWRGNPAPAGEAAETAWRGGVVPARVRRGGARAR